jgi:hypothetical protein
MAPYLLNMIKLIKNEMEGVPSIGSVLALESVCLVQL